MFFYDTESQAHASAKAQGYKLYQYSIERWGNKFTLRLRKFY